VKFFVPLTDDEFEAEVIWSGVRERLFDQGLPTTRRRIQALSLEDDRPDSRLDIGRKTPATGELVMLILEASDAQAYYICTPHRGVLHGAPYTTGLGDQGRAIDFDKGPIDRLWGRYLR
jgi:hypothetical protein